MFASLLASALSFKAWPAKYTIRGTWKVPYTNLSNPITIVHAPGRQYFNQQNGMLQIWVSGPEERFYRKILGNGKGTQCYDLPTDGEWEVEPVQFLPDPEGFKVVNGDYTYHGKTCTLWQKVVGGDKTQTYNMYIDKQGNPVAYVIKAISMFHSHYDVYILEIDEFIPDVLPSYWTIPAGKCDHMTPDPYPGTDHKLFFPGKQSHKNVEKNYAHHIARGKGINGRYSHLSESDFAAHIKKLRQARKARLSLTSNSTTMCKPYKGTPGLELPEEFSWRDVPNVVGKPRDQVACGSCWAFSTAEVLESQFAIKNGKFAEVSTNQILDCTFDSDYDLNGCQGGEVDKALTRLKENGIKIAYEKNYPYIGVSGQYCDNNQEEFLGYVEDCYKVEPKTKSVMEALYKFGPLGIAINVIEPMSLYTGGVIDDETCTGTPSDLVHAVLLTGWKKVDGKLAWEVKNSWSTYWGYEGYVYIQMEDQTKNCGVTTDAIAAVVSLERK